MASLLGNGVRGRNAYAAGAGHDAPQNLVFNSSSGFKFLVRVLSSGSEFGFLVSSSSFWFEFRVGATAPWPRCSATGFMVGTPAPLELDTTLPKT